MKLIFNTAPIIGVGIKIYFDGELKKESFIKGGIYPVFLEIAGEPMETMTLETCYQSELKNPQTPEKYCNEFNSKIYKYDYNGGYIDDCGKLTEGLQFAYKTEIQLLSECPEQLFLDFTSVLDDQCCLCVKNVDFAESCYEKDILKQKFVKRYSNLKVLTRPLLTIVVEVVVAILAIYLLIKHLFIPINNMYWLDWLDQRNMVWLFYLVAFLVLPAACCFPIVTIIRARTLIKTDVIEIEAVMQREKEFQEHAEEWKRELEED